MEFVKSSKTNFGKKNFRLYLFRSVNQTALCISLSYVNRVFVEKEITTETTSSIFLYNLFRNLPQVWALCDFKPEAVLMVQDIGRMWGGTGGTGGIIRSHYSGRKINNTIEEILFEENYFINFLFQFLFFSKRSFHRKVLCFLYDFC